MELKTYFAQDASGNIMPGATVTVYEAGTATLATGLQDESGSPLANPFTADSSAKVAFYAPDGLYDITVVGNGRTVTIRAQFVSIDSADTLRSDLAATGGSALVGADDGASGSLWTTVAGFTAFLLSSLGASVIGFIQAGVGAVWRSLMDRLRDEVSVKDFGAVGNGSVNDTTAFSNALSYCKANGRTLIIPDGNYLITAGVLNFAAQGLNIIGAGRPTLTFTGAGVAFNLDTGLGDGAFLEEMRVENLLIVGNPSTTTGFYSRGIVRSTLRNIEVRECTEDAFDIRHGVSNTYDSLRYSAQGHTTKALRGMRLRANGAGYYTADCTFMNLVSEDFAGSGLYIEDGSGNTFVGGTFEGCANGAVILAGCRRNKLSGVWFEGNSSKDLSDDGVANAYDDCYFGSASSSPTAVMGTAQGAVFKGGYLRTIQLDSTSRDTLFIGVGMDENLSGTLGITGTGTYKSVGMTKVNGTGAVVGQMQDFVGSEGTWTPVDASGAGLTFTGANGYYTKIGKLVFAQGTVTFPATANASAASIGGLPFTVPNLAGARQGFVSFTDETTLFSILPDGGGTTISLRNSSAAALTNATMSGNTVWFTAIYFT